MLKIQLQPKPPFKRLGIAGLGLIGGSLAKALMPFGGLDLYIFDKDPATVAAARKIRRFTAVTDQAETFVSWPLDLAYLCLPVHRNLEMVELMGRRQAPYPVTDAGSTKTPITRAARAAGLVFCGGHPIAGREVSGFQYADAALWQGILFILTPDPAFGPAGQELAANLHKLHEPLRCRVKVMSPAEHDRLYGLVSHLPYLAASALAGTVLRRGGQESLDWAGSGFRDSTRIGAAAPPKWVEIALDNADNLADYLETLREFLGEFKTALTAGDARALLELLSPVAEFRRKLR